MSWITTAGVAAALVACLGMAVGAESAFGDDDANQARETDYSKAIAAVRQAVREELERKAIGGASVALVDGQRTVLVEGFGWADEARKTPADERTIYRVGSISKLFTALAAMQLVERGKLYLDAPIERALPSFRIEVPFDDPGPITLRQLMGHRSGMVREAPVGGYFDFTEPSLAETVASLAGCALVNRPGTKTRYSNLGPSIVGLAVEQVAGQPFEAYQQEHVLGPLGMRESAWRMNDRLRPQAATGYMRVYDGHGGFTRRPAPHFELGTIPAGNLYSTAADMARFAKMLLAEGEAEGGRVVAPATLAQMCTAQESKERPQFGLGFSINEFAGHKTIQHNGAVYGFSCSMVALPEAGVAVVVLLNEDLAMGPLAKIWMTAMEGMLEAKRGEKPESKPQAAAPTKELLAALAGDYESSSYWAEVRVVDGRLVANVSGQKMTLAPVGPMEFEAEGHYVHRSPVVFARDEKDGRVTFTLLDQTFEPVRPAERREVPAAWRGYLGSYGPGYIPLVVSWRNGRLYAMAENMFDYALTPVAECIFRTPKGLYEDEYLVFHRDAAGRVVSVEMANFVLPRREAGGTGQH